MRVGNLVKRKHWALPTRGIVLMVGPKETATDHGKSVVKVQWFDGDLTFEFIKLLEVVSESR